MKNIRDVSGGRGGNAFLLLGEEKTALIDAGMAYCASALIRNCREAIGDRPLDYIIISHSHYDHIGAIPYIRQVWPASKVLGAAYAKRILARPNALKTIRELSEEAARIFGTGTLAPYHDADLHVDQAISEGELIDLGGMQIKVIEMPGHTQCSLAFLVNGNILFASETTGYLSQSGTVKPAFIRSCSEAIASIQKCQKLNPQYIVSPHFGLVSAHATPGYWEKCLQAVRETCAFILTLAQQGCTEEQILNQYEAAFRDEDNADQQPLKAFRLNSEAMISAVLRETIETGYDCPKL